MDKPGHFPDSSGVSEVIGEMLMIALVVVLIAVFSTTISSFLPAERQPSVSVRLTNETADTITLWHKGGDWVKVTDLRIIVANSTDHAAERVFRSADPGNPSEVVPHRTTFDLGSNITIRWGAALDGNETVKLATPDAVLFTGQLGRAGV